MSETSSDDQAKMCSSQRLRQALVAIANDGAMPTASALCEKAEISRNALYRYHQDVVHELHQLQQLRRREPSLAKRRLEQLRNDNDALKLQVSQLAALVDHYFAAWQDASILLKRRENELSDLRKKNNSKLVVMQR